MSVATSSASCILFLALVAPAISSADLKSKYDLGPKISQQQMDANEAKYKAEDAARGYAKSMCIRYIRNNINDPSSAEFPETDGERRLQAQGVKQKNGTWKVTFTGRARNQFNALILVKFQCIVQPLMYEGEQSLMIVSAKQVGV